HRGYWLQAVGHPERLCQFLQRRRQWRQGGKGRGGPRSAPRQSRAKAAAEGAARVAEETTGQQMLRDRARDGGEHHADGEILLLEGRGHAGNTCPRERAGLDLSTKPIELTRIGTDVLNRRA